jgi:O-antigen ligase
MERLTFNVGTRRGGPVVVTGRTTRERPRSLAKATAARAKARFAAVRERYDADYLWMIAFTALVFFRPQEQLPALGVLHLAELTAIGALAAMAARRLSAGQTITHVNPELIGVVALGGVILMTLPFSSWPGGSLTVFSEIYVKIILIFALMMSTLTSPRRLRQMTWVMILASGYIAAHAVLDYVRGVNLVEGDRVRGAVGGFFENPNDLALNLVTFMAPTLFIVLQDRKPSRRILAAGIAAIMAAAIVCTKSRSGFLGLACMLLVVAYYTIKARPGALVAGAFAIALALPMMPSSFWDRMDSIFVAENDPTGSRAARIRLMEQGLEVFVQNPLTGVGAGQFQNYEPPGATLERWRVTHNVWLQVACELGLFGLLVFGYLVVRAYTSCFRALRLLRGPRRRRGKPAPAMVSPWTTEERAILDINAKGILAAMVGWTICSFFASVAFNWTFYYVLALAVAGREVAASRQMEPAAEPETVEPAGRLVRAHA